MGNWLLFISYSEWHMKYHHLKSKASQDRAITNISKVSEYSIPYRNTLMDKSNFKEKHNVNNVSLALGFSNYFMNDFFSHFILNLFDTVFLYTVNNRFMQGNFLFMFQICQ